jgi:hypothetical protein
MLNRFMSISEQELQALLQELANYRANIAASLMRIREIENFLKSKLEVKQSD